MSVQALITATHRARKQSEADVQENTLRTEVLGQGNPTLANTHTPLGEKGNGVMDPHHPEPFRPRVATSLMSD